MKNKQRKIDRALLNQRSKQMKKKRKHKGLPSGTRFNGAHNKQEHMASKPLDPRIGSKKTISLHAEQPMNASINKEKPSDSLHDLQQELIALENSTKLNALLEQLESDHSLTNVEQEKLDSMLSRIEALYVLLGVEENDDQDDEPEMEESNKIMHLLK